MSKVKKYFWNIPWSSTEEYNLKLVQSLQKYIDNTAHLKRSDNSSDFPLCLQLSRNSIFWLHFPLFRSKKIPFDIGNLFSSHCPCAVLAHTDVPRRTIDSKTDPSFTNILSSFDILLEQCPILSSENLTREILDLYHNSYDISEFMNLVLSVSSVISEVNIFTLDWSVEAKELIQNYFIATRKSVDPHPGGDHFDFRFPENSTSQLEINESVLTTPKQSHLGLETPTSIIERIVRLSIILSFLSIPFLTSKNVIRIGIEEVIFRLVVYLFT